MDASRRLRNRGSEDVLVDPAVVRAAITGPDSAADRAALFDVGAVVVFGGPLARIRAGDGVPPIRPDRVGDAADVAHPEVVAGKRHGAVRELLEVRVRGCVREALRGAPGNASVRGTFRVDVERARGCRSEEHTS